MNSVEVTVRILPDGRMNARDAARYLGASEKTLAMWRTQGIGPHYVKRGRIFYFRNDIDEWIGEGRRTLEANPAPRTE